MLSHGDNGDEQESWAGNMILSKSDRTFIANCSTPECTWFFEFHVMYSLEAKKGQISLEELGRIGLLGFTSED